MNRFDERSRQQQNKWIHNSRSIYSIEVFINLILIRIYKKMRNLLLLCSSINYYYHYNLYKKWKNENINQKKESWIVIIYLFPCSILEVVSCFVSGTITDESVVEIGISPIKRNQTHFLRKIDFQFANISNWQTQLSVQDKNNLLKMKK